MLKKTAKRTIGLNSKLKNQMLQFGKDLVGIKAIKIFQQLAFKSEDDS
jgi:hypothetical protein